MGDSAKFAARRPRPLLRTTLGAVLRRARRAQGRTLADVARSARVSMPYLSEVERGRKEASSEVLAAICAALRIELADLLAEVGRELAGRRARRGPALVPDPARTLPLDTARVIPLDPARAGRGPASRPGAAPGHGDAQARLAA